MLCFMNVPHKCDYLFHVEFLLHTFIETAYMKYVYHQKYYTPSLLDKTYDLRTFLALGWVLSSSRPQ